MTPDPGFKVTVVLKGEYLQSDAFYRHSFYIGREQETIGTLSMGKIAIQLTTPLLLHKSWKRFASVARVCQQQLAFLVLIIMDNLNYEWLDNGLHAGYQIQISVA